MLFRSRLTTRLVPQGRHYDAEYCGACEFEGRDHCEFCHANKLSIRRRMPLVRFARELLLLRPTLTAAQMAAEISRRAAASESCVVVLLDARRGARFDARRGSRRPRRAPRAHVGTRRPTRPP